MINKRKYVNELKNLKLVLGNGFDLYCGLSTSIKEYLDSERENVDKVNRWELELRESNKHIKEMLPKFDYEKHPVILNPYPIDVTIWEYLIIKVFFKKRREALWSDLEPVVKDILFKENENTHNTYLMDVFYYLNYFDDKHGLAERNKLMEDSKDSYLAVVILSSYLLRKLELRFKDYNDLLMYFFDELKRFERKLSKYIRKEYTKPTYKNAYMCTLRKLCNIDNITSIDSFNFTKMLEFKDIFKNINGSDSAPIIGIEADGIDINDLRYRFTKLYRRILNQIDSNELEPNIDCSNLIIFGSSMRECDYSYYFPIFDSMGLGDKGFRGTIVFAYSVYEEDLREEIKEELIKSINKLLSEYQNKVLKNKTNGLVDWSYTKGSIVLYEIDGLDI